MEIANFLLVCAKEAKRRHLLEEKKMLVNFEEVKIIRISNKSSLVSNTVGSVLV